MESTAEALTDLDILVDPPRTWSLRHRERLATLRWDDGREVDVSVPTNTHRGDEQWASLCAALEACR